MQDVFLTVVGVELGDDGFDVLTMGAIGDQYRVGSFDDHEVVNADQTHQTAGSMDQGVAAVGGEDVADVSVAGFVFGQYLPDGVPGAEVAPTGREWHHLTH